MPLTKASYSLINGAPINVRDFGALGNGSNDDTAAIQAAINYCQDNLLPLYFPPNVVSQYYKTSAPLVVIKPITMFSDNQRSTTILAVGLSAGQYVLDIDGTSFGTFQEALIKGFTFFAGSGNCLRIKDVSMSVFEDIGVRNCVHGIVYTGTRCYHNVFNRVQPVTAVTGNTIRMTNHTGGGPHSFYDCTFGGSIGFILDQNSAVDSINFYDCNFEQCTSQGLYVAGTVVGLGLYGGRTEGGDAIDFLIRPESGNIVSAINVNGVSFFSSDNGGVPRISLGGSAGIVRGFNIVGNYVGHGANNFSSSFVQLNGDGESGTVANNYLNGSISQCSPINVLRPSVAVYNNEGNNGKFAPSFSLTQSTFTATATGMTTSPTGTVKYSIIGNTVTLDIPAISGTSNSTAFTLTGAPAAIAPTADKDVLIGVTDNGTTQLGFVKIKTTGVLEFYANIGGGVFTSSGTKAVRAFSVTYTLA